MNDLKIRLRIEHKIKTILNGGKKMKFRIFTLILAIAILCPAGLLCAQGYAERGGLAGFDSGLSSTTTASFDFDLDQLSSSATDCIFGLVVDYITMNSNLVYCTFVRRLNHEYA